MPFGNRGTQRAMDARRNERILEDIPLDLLDIDPINIDLQGRCQTDYMTDDLQSNSLLPPVTPSNSAALTPPLEVSYSGYQNLGGRPRQSRHRNENFSTRFLANQQQLQSSHGLTHSIHSTSLIADNGNNSQSNENFGVPEQQMCYPSNSQQVSCIYKHNIVTLYVYALANHLCVA